MRRLCGLAGILSSLALTGIVPGAANAEESPAAQPAAKPADAAPAVQVSTKEILEKMEKVINGFDDQVMEVKLTVVDVDGSKKTYEFTISQKGDAKRLAQFTSGEIKGMATLVEDRNSVYVYLPGFKKVRRVAAHNMSQSLVGSDLSNDDMAMVSWTKAWDAKLDKEDATSWTLVLIPKPDEKTDYGKVIHKVEKQTFVLVESQYFNRAGEKVKLWQNSNFTEFQPGVRRCKNVIISDPRTGHRTEMEIKSFRVNQGLKDDLFTVRQLQWGK
jgi:outer membrane lipoprotein-sorting protein